MGCSPTHYSTHGRLFRDHTGRSAAAQSARKAAECRPSVVAARCTAAVVVIAGGASFGRFRFDPPVILLLLLLILILLLLIIILIILIILIMRSISMREGAMAMIHVTTMIITAILIGTVTFSIVLVCFIPCLR